jgi:peptide/nickel transport system ATP-binding protein
VALVGESGSGKSVTALSILGLLPRENSSVLPGSEVLFGGRNLLELSQRELRDLRGKEISMIFQEPMSSLNPVFSVGFQLSEVLRLHMGLSPGQARARGIALLGEVGIPEPEKSIDKYPFQMSGGQQQRVMIAMAIACEPKLLIADEPTTALDVTIQKQILELIGDLQKKHQMSVLFITHDLAVVGEIADFVVVMRDGEIREQGAAADVFERPRDAYTQALLQCRPQLNRRAQRLYHTAGPGAGEDAPRRGRRRVRREEPGKSFGPRGACWQARVHRALSAAKGAGGRVGLGHRSLT